MPIRFQLDNGLTVVFQEEHAAKVVAFQIWVKAGSADERPDQAGLAHLHEHMLFKGTKHRGVGQIAKEVEAQGGDINAWTSYDETVYHTVMASAFARTGLEVLADAVRFSTFDAAELARESEVVCEEIKRSEDSPGRRIWKNLASTHFEKHPYRLPIIGTEASVRGFTRERVVEFYEHHYTPRNMVVAIAGDVSEQEVRAWSQELLAGDWGRPYGGAPARPPEPPQTGRRAAIQNDDVKEAYLYLAFPLPGVNHPDIPALDTLGVALGQGHAAPLSLTVKRKLGLVNDISASSFTLKDSGLFMLSMTLPPENLARALEELGRIVGEAIRSPLAASELQRAQRLVESEAVYARESAQGLARKLGFYESTMGGFEAEQRYYAAVAALTPETIHQAAQKHIDLGRVTLAALLPEGVTLSAEEAFASLEKGWKPKARAKATPTASTAGGVVTHVLKNGARILVREEHEVPLFALRAAWQAGTRYESDADAGISALLARMWTRGTPSRNAEEISRRLDGMAGGLGGAPGRNSIGLRGEFLSRHRDEALELFQDVLLHPSFPEQEFAREQRLMLQNLATREDRPSGLVSELFQKALYPGHPYRLPLGGEVESVRALTPGMLQSYHARLLNPSRLHLAIVGDVNTDEVLAWAEAAFQGPASSAGAEPVIAPLGALLAPQQTERVLTKAQTHLMLGFRGAKLNDPWRFPLEVLANALSGMGGRLFLTLRDQQSLAYSVTAYAVEGIDPGYFAVYMGTSPDKQKAALEGIRLQLNRVRDELISPEELARSRQNLIGSHEIGLQRTAARAALLSLDDCYGLGLTGFLNYAEQISKVTAEQVREVARRVIQWEQSVLAQVGPQAGPAAGSSSKAA